MNNIDLSEYIKVGNLTEDISNKINFKYTGQVYASPGVIKHIKKRHKTGKNALSYYVFNNVLLTIEDVIMNPDYIGNHPGKIETSIELVKKIDDNLLVALEVDLDNNYIYVSSLYPISESKLKNRLISGRLIKYEEDFSIDNIRVLE